MDTFNVLRVHFMVKSVYFDGKNSSQVVQRLSRESPHRFQKFCFEKTFRKISFVYDSDSLSFTFRLKHNIFAIRPFCKKIILFRLGGLPNTNLR